MAHIRKKVLSWRRRKDPGEIMSPKTFRKIKLGAAKKYGSKERGEKVAGAAYWKTVKAKYRDRKVNKESVYISEEFVNFLQEFWGKKEPHPQEIMHSLITRADELKIHKYINQFKDKQVKAKIRKVIVTRDNLTREDIVAINEQIRFLGDELERKEKQKHVLTFYLFSGVYVLIMIGNLEQGKLRKIYFPTKNEDNSGSVSFPLLIV
jgi:hypothetical protein